VSERVLRRLLLRATALPVAVLAVTSAVLAAQVLHLQRLNEWVDHTDVVIARVTRLERLSSDHQSECRGYLLSGNEALLEPFANVDHQLSPALADLKQLVAGAPDQEAAVERVRDGVEQWRAFARELVARRSRGLGVEQAALTMTAGRPIMARLRAQVRALMDGEERLRASRLAHARNATRLTLVTAFALVVVLGGFAALAARDVMARLKRAYAEALSEQARAQEAVLRSEARLRAQAEALREADRRKDEFLGMLSHELRNPLAPILNSVNILDRSDATGEQVRHARAVIARQAGHLGRLVDDLLDVTRIARGKIELHRARIDLSDVVKRTGEDYRELLEQRGLAFALEVPREPMWVEGDATRLAQVVGNLLQNAAKFTPQGGAVEVSLSAGPTEVELRVRDTGSGIEAALIDRIFEPFTQGEQGLARTAGGLGLGLALVKAVAELHRGSVEARSGGPGQGSELVVRLPSAAPPASPGPDPREVRAAGEPHALR
jgi:signal transduction histidine kinase